jgi:phage terminase large subunit
VKVIFGGRVGAKTVNIARALLFYGAKEKRKILCLREFMNSIDDSVHSTFRDQIDLVSMNHLFKPQHNKINGTNGTIIRYDNFARNINSIKGKDNFDYYWVEEAETAAQKSLDILEPTARKETSEIWISFNPEDEFGPVYKTYVTPYIDQINANGYYEDDNIYVCKTSIYDNPFASDKAIQTCEALKEKDYKKWLWVYGGDPYGDYTDSIIQPEWFDSAIDAHIKLGFEPLGVKSCGFDPADTGDAKATVHRHGSVITKIDEWTEGEITEGITRAFQNCDEHKDEFQVYDANGLGASMKVYSGSVQNPDDWFQEPDPKTGHPGIKNKQRFKNRRSQDYCYFADRLEATHNAVQNGLYTNPEKLISISSEVDKLDKFKAELVKIKRVRKNNMFYEIQSKKDAMKEDIKSPNIADAAKMCFANPAPTAETVPLEFDSEF